MTVYLSSEYKPFRGWRMPFGILLNMGIGVLICNKIDTPWIAIASALPIGILLSIFWAAIFIIYDVKAYKRSLNRPPDITSFNEDSPHWKDYR